MLRAALITALIASAGAAQAQTTAPCPPLVPAGAACFNGKDVNGAYYWIVRPASWNGVLVVHTHGGPRLGNLGLNDSVEDFDRFIEMIREGYAWVGSSYRISGYGVRIAAEDTEIARKLAIATLGKPRRTLIHGQSWGGNIAAKTVALHGIAADGSKVYDGALLTSGVMAGGTRGYDYRADLRAVWQFYCNNHPRPSEPAYPLWLGLPAGSTMTRPELQARFNECTGLNKPAAERSEEQRRITADLVAVTRIEERALYAHLAWGTFQFRDLVQTRLNGKNPFSNENVRYAGSRDDDKLNREVIRFRADPDGQAALAHDSDLTGKIGVPVITLHAIDDPTAFVEHESHFRAQMERAGNGDLLVQVFANEREHSKLSPPHYPAVLNALLAWVETGRKPTVAEIAAACETHRVAHPGECRINVGYQPRAYDARVYPREAPSR